MDIASSYNCLLERPWIHSATIVALNFEIYIENKVVSIRREEDIIVATLIDAPYVKPDEDIPEYSYQSFEFVNATSVQDGLPMVQPCLSENTHMGLKLISTKVPRLKRDSKKTFKGLLKH